MASSSTPRDAAAAVPPPLTLTELDARVKAETAAGRPSEALASCAAALGLARALSAPATQLQARERAAAELANDAAMAALRAGA